MLTKNNSIIRLSAIILFLLISACVSTGEVTPGRGDIIPWQALPGWQQDNLETIWPALKNNCLTKKLPEGWKNTCSEISMMGQADADTIRAYIETRFVARQLVSTNNQEGLITGYYEPILNGSLKPDSRYRYPVYGRPKDLVVIKLDKLYPELAGKTIRGRLDGNYVVPFYSRAEIDNGRNQLAGLEIAWVDDSVDLFFLHVQGSGRIRLPDGRVLSVGYADQNGHPYESIGLSLIRRGVIKREDVSLYTIRSWLDENPEELEQILFSNPSYIFFTVRDQKLTGPLGSLGVPLTAERSLAIDKSFTELGSLVWVDTTFPGEQARPYQRLMVAQDTGGAIKGVVRADVFFGRGDRARDLAGTMKQAGSLYILELNPARIVSYTPDQANSTPN
ncbi:MAG: murein transglycosylase A [Acidiferrobacterales bacterium]